MATLELRGDVPRPDEQAYDDARRVWNEYDPSNHFRLNGTIVTVTGWIRGLPSGRSVWRDTRA